MKKFILYSVVIFSFIFNAVFIIHLYGMKESESDRQFDIYRNLNLSNKQQKTIENMCLPYKKMNDNLENRLASKRALILNLLKKKEVDMKKVEKCVDEINSLQKQIQMNVLKQMIIFKKNMNPDQCGCFLNNLGEKMDVSHVCDENCSCKSE